VAKKAGLKVSVSNARPAGTHRTTHGPRLGAEIWDAQINKPYGIDSGKAPICLLRSNTKTPPCPRRAADAESSGFSNCYGLNDELLQLCKVKRSAKIARLELMNKTRLVTGCLEAS
jgi:hypothetical protein